MSHPAHREPKSLGRSGEGLPAGLYLGDFEHRREDLDVERGQRDGGVLAEDAGVEVLQMHSSPPRFAHWGNFTSRRMLNFFDEMAEKMRW